MRTFARTSNGFANRLGRKTSCGFATAFVLLMNSAPAHAGGAPAAEALFNQARAAMDQKDYDTACQRFRESNRLDPATGTLVNLAVCEEARGRIATAWELFRTAYEKLDSNDSRADFAKAHADQLEPRVPKLTMKLAHGAPDDTHVRDGDSAYFGASLGVPIPMDPGKHSLIVDAPGHEAQTIEIALVEGAQQLVEVAPGPEKPPPSSSSVPANALAPDSRLRSPRHDAKTVGFVIGGAGVLGLGVGAVAGMMALGKQRAAEDGCDYVRRTCTQQGIDAASAGHTLAVVSTVGWIAGAVGVGAGTYFVLTSSRARPETALAAEMRPGGVTVSLRRRF